MRKTFVLVMLLTPPASANKFKLEYLDFLGAEAVGELQPRIYDLQLDDKFAGTLRFRANPLISGGFGLRIVGREPTGNSNGGVRFAVGGGGQWGRFQDSATSLVTRYELIGSVGYEGTLGILVLHTASVVGFDYQSFDFGKGANLSTFSLRAGQEVGLHLHVASVVALYADGTIDWDGQWRVRAGISVGQLIRKAKSSPESTGALAPPARARSIFP